MVSRWILLSGSSVCLTRTCRHRKVERYIPLTRVITWISLWVWKNLSSIAKKKMRQRSVHTRPGYIGSLVADFHRNMLKGGVFLYPQTSSHPTGKLRLLYECNPMAFIAEQSGGLATDGERRIMEIKPEALHQRVPLYTGSRNMVQKVQEFLTFFNNI